MSDVPITGHGFLFIEENSVDEGMGYVQIQMRGMPVPDDDFLHDLENLFTRAGYSVEFDGPTVDVRVLECPSCQGYSQRLDSVTRMAHGLVRKVSYYRNKLFQAIDLLDDPDDVLSLFEPDTIDRIRESMPSTTPPAGVGDRRAPTQRNY